MSNCPESGHRCKKVAPCDTVAHTRWQFYYVQCNPKNPMCNNTSGAWLPASTICSQRLNSCLFPKGGLCN